MLLYVVLTIICAIITYNVTDYYMYNYSKASRLFNIIKEPWKYEEELKGKDKDTIILTNTIPKNYNPGDILCIRFGKANLRVFLKDELIYHCRLNERKISNQLIDKRWHYISLKNVEPGDKITLEVQDYQRTYSRNAFSFLYGDLNEIVAYMIKQILINLNLSGVVLFSGFFILLIKFFIDKNLDKFYIYIGIFFIGFGLWSFINIRLSIMPQGYSIGGLILENFILIFDSIIYLLYIREKYELKESKVLKWYINFTWFYFITWIILLFFRNIFTFNIAVISAIMITANVVFEICWVTYQSIRSNKFNFIQWFGIFVFTQCSILEIMRYVNNKFYFSGLIIRAGIIFYLVTQLIITLKEVNKKLRKKAVLKQQLEESRMRLMTRQMEPHFFSNALIAIQDLCYTDPEKAADSIALFYSYLRTNMIYANQEGLVSFNEERKLIEMYIKIQKLCFGDEIEFEEHIETKDFHVPPLSIQPFVENAVKHGIRKRRGFGRVKLSAYYQGEEIVVKVEDDGVGFGVSDMEDLNSGFSSTRNITYRLEKQCKGKVTIDSKEGKGTIVTIILPGY